MRLRLPPDLLGPAGGVQPYVDRGLAVRRFARVAPVMLFRDWGGCVEDGLAQLLERAALATEGAFVVHPEAVRSAAYRTGTVMFVA